jgi:hypothetical protein
LEVGLIRGNSRNSRLNLFPGLELRVRAGRSYLTHTGISCATFGLTANNAKSREWGQMGGGILEREANDRDSSFTTMNGGMLFETPLYSRAWASFAV